MIIAPDGFASPGFEYDTPAEVPAALGLMQWVLPKPMLGANLAPAYAKAEQLTDSVVVSLWISLATAAIALALGVPAAFASVRGTFAGKSAANAFLLAPQMMPGMVIGIASLFFGAYFAFRASNAMLMLGLVSGAPRTAEASEV